MTEHGSNSTYNHGCRCAECRYAHTLNHRVWRAEQKRLAQLGKAVEAAVLEHKK